MYKRFLCLDVGERRIGVAVSDPLGITAQGVEVFINKGMDSVKEEIVRLSKTYDLEKVIVGYPLNMDGTEGNKARSVREFAETLGTLIDFPVELQDERLSTKEAQWALREEGIDNKKQYNVIDMLSAQVILQSYLETKANKLNNKTEQNNSSERKGARKMDEDKILLVDDDGKETEFIIDDTFIFEDTKYIVLVENEDDEDALIFKVEEEKGEEFVLVDIDDDDEFERVSNYYFELDDEE